MALDRPSEDGVRVDIREMGNMAACYGRCVVMMSKMVPGMMGIVDRGMVGVDGERKVRLSRGVGRAGC